jgi:hypothetical protein
MIAPPNIRIVAHSAFFAVVLFSAFVLAGTCYIVLAKFAGVSAVLVTSIPLALMILYALLLGLARYLRLRDDQAGDNLYYIGFLYTLTSLGVSLWQFSADHGAESIVTNFGVAIASTILGVALRVIFNQMRQDPMEVERTARLELAEAARHVRQELDATVLEFSSFRRAGQQVLEEAAVEIAKSTERVARGVFEAINDIPQRSVEALLAGSQRSTEIIDHLAMALTERLDESGDQLTAQLERFATTVKETSEGLASLDARLKAMQTPDAIIEIKLQPFIRGFTKAVKEQSAANAEQAQQLRQIIATFDQSIRTLSDRLQIVLDERRLDQTQLAELIAVGDHNARETKRLLSELEKHISTVVAKQETPWWWFR